MRALNGLLHKPMGRAMAFLGFRTNRFHGVTALEWFPRSDRSIQHRTLNERRSEG